MVESIAQRILEDPCKFANIQFESSKEQPNSDNDYGLTNLIRDNFGSETTRRMITSINKRPIEEFSHNQLVLFDAFVRDLNYSQETFVGAYFQENTWKSARYTNIMPNFVWLDSQHTLLEERKGMLCTKIPGSFIDKDYNIICKWYHKYDENVKVCDTIRVIGIFECVDSNEEAILNFNDNIKINGIIHVLYYEDVLNVPKSGFNTYQRKNFADFLDSELAFLLKDYKAAELLIYSLISRIETLNLGTLIGKFVLNLTGMNDSAICESLKNFLEKISYYFVYQKLTLQNLNNLSLFPSHDDIKFNCGLLQVGKYTTVLLDETNLEEGSLNELGVFNLKFLTNLCQDQNITFRYPFSEFLIKTNVCIIIISKQKSFLPADYVYKVDGKEHIERTYAQDISFTDIKDYLLDLKLLSIEISKTTAEQIQEIYVASRKENPNIGPLDLIRWINMAKLRAKSLNRKLIREDFDHVMMEFKN